MSESQSFRDTEFMERGNCLSTDPDLFTPDNGNQYTAEIAKEICRRCVVLLECQAWAIPKAELTHGIIGGLNARERQQLRQRLTS